MYKHILIATDGSEVATKGLEHGLSLAKVLNAALTIITITEPFPIFAAGSVGVGPSGPTITDYESLQQQTAKSILVTAIKAAEDIGVKAETVHVADAQPAEAILEAAKSRNCDIIVMGSHGRRGIGRIVIGSKTWEVIAHSDIPVLVARG